MFRLHALGAAAGQSTSGKAPRPETNEGGKGHHGGTTSVTGNGPTTHGCRTAERRMGGHCAAPRARRHEGGGWARAAAQSPITRKPANTRANGTMQAAARKHAVDMGHLGPKNVGGSRSGAHRRSAPSRGHGSASHKRANGAATLPTPSSSSCMQHPGVGPGRVTEDTANAAPPSRAEHRPFKGHGPHRRGRARRVGRSPIPSRHTRVRDPPYRYKPHMSSRRAKTRRLP